MSAASSFGVDDAAAAAAAAGVCGLGVVGLGGGVFVISPKGFLTPFDGIMDIMLRGCFQSTIVLRKDLPMLTYLCKADKNSLATL